MSHAPPIYYLCNPSRWGKKSALIFHCDMDFRLHILLQYMLLTETQHCGTRLKEVSVSFHRINSVDVKERSPNNFYPYLNELR